MSEVSTRPTIIDEATIKDVSLTYDFPSITTWRVDNMSYEDLNIQGVNKFFTDSSERQAVRFNNTDYVFNGILLTKQGDIFTNTNLDGGMIISVMLECHSTKNKEEKLFITIPCNRSDSPTSPSLKSLIDNSDKINENNVEIGVDMNSFIPQTDFYYYTYVSNVNPYEKIFIVFDGSEITISEDDFDELDDLKTPESSFKALSSFQVSQSSTPAIRKPIDVFESEDIYIDCSPESDANTRIIKPKRVFAVKKMDLFGLDAVEGYGKVFAFMLMAVFILAIVFYGEKTILSFNFNLETNEGPKLSESLQTVCSIVLFFLIGFMLARGPVVKEERDSLLKSLYSDTGVYVMYGLYAVIVIIIIAYLYRNEVIKNISRPFVFILGAIIGLMYMIQYLVLSEEYRSNDQDIVLFSVAISLLYTVYQVVPKYGNVSVE
tara:strand:- start:23 stop:1321 length:1299 start_codon:yes stop_codon:yes gene_type:complete